MKRRLAIFILLPCIALALLTAGLFVGGVSLAPSQVTDAVMGNGDSLGRFIVMENRLPALLTALIAGASLSVAGLLMQTCFNNPLAGPSIMGISSGASVGVAIVMMAAGGALGWLGNLAVVGGALAGAMAVMALLVFFSGIVRSADALLIVGILIGYLAGSVISLLNFFSTDRAVHSFVLWGLGTFTTVGLDGLPLFSGLCTALVLCSLLYAKSLNAMLFGERFARNVGVRVTRVRTALLLLSGCLTAVVTAWCGPIGFIGLVVPHIARILTGGSNHKYVLPASALTGACLGVLCQIASSAPSLSSGAVIPVNAITPFIGVPVIIYVMLNRKKLLYFN